MDDQDFSVPNSSGILLLDFLRKVLPSKFVDLYHVPFLEPTARIDLATLDFAISHSSPFKYFEVQVLKLLDLLPPIPLDDGRSPYLWDFGTSTSLLSCALRRV
jgi:hypothetical protein